MNEKRMESHIVAEDNIVFHANNEEYRTSLAICKIPGPFQNLSFLHQQELSYFNSLQFERRIYSYSIGRFAAKKAVARLAVEMPLNEIFIDKGIFGYPVVNCPSQINLQVSLTHSEPFAAAIAFPEHFPVGIDVEKIDQLNYGTIIGVLTERERRLLYNAPDKEQTIATIIWTAKESLSKILKTGLTTALDIFELEEIVCRQSIYSCTFKHFSQYCAASFLFESYVISITYPKNAVVNMQHIQALLRKLSA